MNAAFTTSPQAPSLGVIDLLKTIAVGLLSPQSLMADIKAQDGCIYNDQ